MQLFDVSSNAAVWCYLRGILFYKQLMLSLPETVSQKVLASNFT